MKEFNIGTFKEYYVAPVFICVLLIIMTFFYYKWDASVKDHAAYIQSINAEKTKNDINKPSDTVVKREVDLYPKINANIAQINKDVKSLNESIKRLEKNNPTKEQSNAKFQDENIKELSDFFNTNGYPNTIISGK